jgi:hypothetical protein
VRLDQASLLQVIERLLGRSIAPLSRPIDPAERFLPVLGNTQAVEVGDAEAELGRSMALLGCEMEPTDSLFMVLANA